MKVLKAIFPALEFVDSHFIETFDKPKRIKFEINPWLFPWVRVDENDVYNPITPKGRPEKTKKSFLEKPLGGRFRRIPVLGTVRESNRKFF